MESGSGGSYGIPQKRLHGHGHFVSCVVFGRTFRLVWILGQDTALMGLINRKHNSTIR